jgi:hypothetical protein
MDWMLLLLPMPFFIGMLLDALAWKALLPGHLKIGVASLYGPQIGAEAVLLSIPGGFAMTDAIKLFILKHRSGIPARTVAASLIMRHWMLGVTQLLFISSVCFANILLIQDSVVSMNTHLSAVLVAIFVLLAVSITLGIIVNKLIQGTLARTIWKFLFRFKIPAIRKRLKRLATSFKQADIDFAETGRKKKGYLALAFFLYEMLWLMDVCETLLVAHAMGFQISFVNALLAEAVLSAVRLGVFFLPGGIIIKDLGYIAIFSSMNVPMTTAAMAAFVVAKRFVSLFCIAVGYAALLMLGVRWKSKRLLSYNAVLNNQ